MISSDELREKAVQLAWSLWSELGLSAWSGHHAKWFVDPEPLLVFTGCLGHADARLRDEAMDWCLAYGQWLSTTRAANLVRKLPESSRSACDDLLHLVHEQTATRAATGELGSKHTRTGRSRLDDFRSPARVSLRLRGLVGVGARAEVLRALLSRGRKGLAVADLVTDAAFTRRMIALALDGLRLSGIVEVNELHRQAYYSLSDPLSVRRLLGTMPTVWPRWTTVLPVLSGAIELIERVHGMPRAARVEVGKFERTSGRDIELAGLPRLPETGVDVPALAAWADHCLSHLARGDATVFRDGAHRDGRARSGS